MSKELKTLKDVIDIGKDRYAENPRAFESQTQAIFFAVSEYLWNAAKDVQHTPQTLVLFCKITGGEGL